KQAYERLRLLLDKEEMRREVEDTIFRFVDNGDALPTHKSELLACLITARAGGVEQARDAFSAAEAAVDAMLVHVRQTVQTSKLSGGGLTAVHNAGAQLKAAATDA